MNSNLLNLLAFDTSTDVLSIAVQRVDGSVLRTWEHSGPGGAQASAALIPAIRALMAQAGLEFGDLAAIVFGRGPGSFTGLRTACSVAQGLAFGAQPRAVPVLPVDTLLAVAEEARFQLAAGEISQGRPAPARLQVMAMLDARMDQIYRQNYDFESEVWLPLGSCEAISPEAARWSVPPGQAEPHPADQQPGQLMAGNVFASYGDRLPEAAWPRCSAWPTASALLRLAPQLLQAGLAVPAEQALPLYIRDKVAQTTQERLLAKAQSATQTPAAAKITR